MPLEDPLRGIPPLAIDLILLGAFDWRELTLLLQSQGLPVEPAERGCLECAFGATRAAILASRESPRFRRALARRMDLLAAAERAQLALTASGDLGQRLAGLHRRPSEEVVRWLWALARDPRPEAQEALGELLSKLHTAALWLFMRPPPLVGP
jgi:hypothetical protein